MSYQITAEQLQRVHDFVTSTQDKIYQQGAVSDSDEALLALAEEIHADIDQVRA